MLKKLAMALGVVFVLFVAAAVIVPMLVDVDKYRPQITEAVDRQINGKLELGKLSLSLWGQIRVEVAGLKLADSAGRNLVSVKSAYFHLPFLSILSGEPSVIFKMREPVVQIVRDRAGKMNLMSLAKAAPVAPGTPAAPAVHAVAPAAPVASRPIALPGFLARSRLGFELRHARIGYRDEKSELNAEIRDLNFVVKNFSLVRPMEMEIWADLDTKLGKAFALKGPMKITATANPQLSGGTFAGAELSAKADFDQVSMIAPGTFEKRSGVPADAEISASISTNEIKLKSLTARFFNAVIQATGGVTHLGGSPSILLALKSNEVQLSEWTELLPMLKEYELGGTFRLNAQASGPMEKVGYRANLALEHLTASSPKLKAKPVIDGTVSVVTDQIDNLSLSMKAPGNDLRIHGKLVSFTQPRLTLEIASSGMDLDQLIRFTPLPKSSASSGAVTAGSSTGAKKGDSQAPDYDAMLVPLRENKTVQGFSAGVTANIPFIKAYDVKISNIAATAYFRDLTAGIEKFGMNVFGGSIKASAQALLKPRVPTYKFSAVVEGLDLAQAVQSQFHFFKNTVIGKAHFDLTGDGASFNPSAAIAKLRAKGSLKIVNASFTTVDAGKLASDAINKALAQVGDKFPGLGGKRLQAPPKRESAYEFVQSSFTIAGGKFSAPDFYAKSKPNGSLDMKGNTLVGLKDESLDARWQVIDTYNLTQARGISVQINGAEVPHILAEGNGPVVFPVHVGCTYVSPCYSYEEVPQYFAKVAANNVAAAMTGRARQQLTNQILKNAPPAIQNSLGNLGKKLFQ